MYKWEKLKHHHHKSPSFSSSLLHQIIQSLEETERQTALCSYTTLPQHSYTKSDSCFTSDPQVVQKRVIARTRKPHIYYLDAHDDKHGSLHHHRNQYDVEDSLFFGSSSSTSDSSFASLSSSEPESLSKCKPRSSCFRPLRPKPIKTSVSPRDMSPLEKQYLDEYTCMEIKGNLKFEKGSTKSKSREMKIPVSPSARLVSFINGLKDKCSRKPRSRSKDRGLGPDSQPKPGGLGCSFLRSCIREYSPSCTSKSLDEGIKRTVRFCPVSVIIDEESRPCGHKCLHDRDLFSNSNLNSMISKSTAMEKSRKLEEFALDLLNGYWDDKFDRDANVLEKEQDRTDTNTDDDDDLSCSSSDLFEIDHLSLVENRGRYHAELPLYESTHLDI